MHSSGLLNELSVLVQSSGSLSLLIELSNLEDVLQSIETRVIGRKGSAKWREYINSKVGEGEKEEGMVERLEHPSSHDEKEGRKRKEERKPGLTRPE